MYLMGLLDNAIELTVHLLLRFHELTQSHFVSSLAPLLAHHRYSSAQKAIYHSKYYIQAVDRFMMQTYPVNLYPCVEAEESISCPYQVNVSPVDRMRPQHHRIRSKTNQDIVAPFDV